MCSIFTKIWLECYFNFKYFYNNKSSCNMKISMMKKPNLIVKNISILYLFYKSV